MAGDQIPVPRLVSRDRTMWWSAGAAVVAVPAVVVWAFLTQPVGNRVAAVVLGSAALVVLAVLLGRTTRLDAERGEVVREVWKVRRRSLAWADADVVRVRDNRAGQLLLEVRDRGQRGSVYLPLVASDLGGERSQTPEFLRLLAEQIESWAPARVAVVGVLRAQADHLAAGGSVRESPLVRGHRSGPAGRRS